MSAKSKAQRHVAAVAIKVKRLEMRITDVPTTMRDDVKSMMSMSEKQLTDFAGTKEKGLPLHTPKTSKRSKK